MLRTRSGRRSWRETSAGAIAHIMNLVQLEGVGKSYRVYDSAFGRVQDLLTFGHAARHRDFRALHEISFTVGRGETVGILGANGSGKSTLLQIIAGILQPTSGAVSVHGRLSALLELGSGFNPEFTGRENVRLNASILGLSRREIDARFPRIAEFAAIGEFIDRPVKTYSTGMMMRLAFAVAIHADPEILLVDEALAVGDIGFQQRCLRRIHELRRQGTTILFVSHNPGDVQALCDWCIWLDRGEMRERGATDVVVSRYLASMYGRDRRYQAEHEGAAERLAAPVETADTVRGYETGGHRFGNRAAEVLGIAIETASGERTSMLRPGTQMLMLVSVRIARQLASPIVGLVVGDDRGVTVFGTNTAREGIRVPPMLAGGTHTVAFRWTIPDLRAGVYRLSPGIADGTLEDYEMCDYIEAAAIARVPEGADEVEGFVRLPCRVRASYHAAAE